MTEQDKSTAKTPRIDQAVVAYAHNVIRFRWVIIALTLLMVVTTASGARFLGLSVDYRDWFSDENPQLQAFEELQRIYTNDDNINFVIKPKDGDVFTSVYLNDIKELTDQAWQLPFTRRVDSITNFQHSFAVGDDLTVRDLVPDPATVTAEELANIRAVALSDPLVVNRLISPDGRTTSVNVTISFPGKSTAENQEIMSAARALADTFRTKHPDARVAITGVVPLNNAFQEAGQNDATTLVPAMYGLLLLVMMALLRSISATVATLLVIGFSAATAMGIAGWMGIKLTPVSFTAPTIILTLAIADSIHLLVTMFKEMRQGATKRAAIVESLRINFGPIFLTSVTTIVGFLSLNFSDAPPFRDFGNITAVGVAAAWAYSIVFLPAAIAILPLKIKPQKADRMGSSVNWLAEFIIKRRWQVFIGTAGVAVILVALIPRIELNDQFVRYFDESLEFRSDSDFAGANLAGVYQVNWPLQANGSGGISDPDFLKNTKTFSDWLLEQPEVTHVATLTDVFARLNKNMHGDDPAYYRLADERNLSAQYLLLYELSLPYGLDLNNQINVDKSAMRLIITVDDITTVQLREFQARAQSYLEVNFPSAATSEASSAFIMFANISQRNINGMLTGTFIAFLIISFLLFLALRSLKVGLISLVPNLLPAAMAFGFWAVFVGQIGLASATVVATSLGIIVDATVHFLSKYVRARRERSATPEDAIRYAFSTVGTALWVTSAILIVGFSVLAFSTFKINGDMGLLTAMAIAAALAVDFLLLPALLLIFEGRQRPGASQLDTPVPAE